jgi:hypothetical protein
MKNQGWVFGLFLGCVLVAEASCSSDYRSSRPEDDDDDGAGGAGSVTSTGSGEPSSSSSGAGGMSGTGGSGGMCAQGGEPCDKSTDCCSGLCDIDVCVSCSGEGQFCGQGCCQGLTCNDGACSACKPLNAACSFADDCCSKNCEFGACVPACSPVGSGCFDATECCSGICTGGVCQSEPCVTCSEYFLQPSGGTLCPDSQVYYEDLAACVCPLCGGVCSSACEGGPASPECQNCAFAVGGSGGPCEMQLMACANDV